jgi:hypothetical protein
MKRVSCQLCGQEWPRDPRLEVSCPTCGAAIGVRCRRPSGHNVFGGQPHQLREEAAIVAGFMTRECAGSAKRKRA